MLSADEVLKQSESAFGQWRETWDSHAEKNGKKFKEDGNAQKDLLFSGAGKKLLCVGMGPSFETNIEAIKNRGEGVDIACVDKAFFYLMEQGIKPQYVFLADAGISFADYCEKHLEETKDIILISNVTANVDWTLNWKGKVFFYVNKDNIKTEERYGKISGCNEVIPAASNVGNSVVVFSAQILGYDEYLLVGYDYCFGYDDNYYAFNDNNKRYWMAHHILMDKRGRMVKTSQNLLFSARWLADFYNTQLKTKGIKVFDCSGKGICGLPEANLSKKLNYKPRVLNDIEKNQIIQGSKESIVIGAQEGNEKLNDALKNNFVTEIVVNHIPKRIINLVEAIT